MGVRQNTLLIALTFVFVGASAQDISVEEMQMLDQLRSQYAAKGIELKPADEIRMLQRLRALKAVTAPSAATVPAATVIAPTAAVTPPVTAPARSTSPPVTETLPVAAAVVDPPVTPDRVAPVIAVLSPEAQLQQQLSELPVGAPLASYQLLRDGLMFNGQRFADAEGKAERFALDPDTATVSYVVANGSSAAVKVARLGTDSNPLTIGNLSRNGSQTVFRSVTGKTLAGDLFFPMTDGALLVRDAVGFRYVVGQAVRQINFPAGWSPAPLQRGNTSTTGWMLLERDVTEEKKNPFEVFKALGEIVGAVAARTDYALFNLNDQKLVTFEVSVDGKSVASYSQCRRASNGLVNVCDRMNTYDSLWRTDGSPNVTHYFWSIDWQLMHGKPVAVAMENGHRYVNAYDLSGTKRVNLFERLMGINNWMMELAGEGKYRVKAQLAFDHPVIEDVAQELQNRPEMPRVQ